MNTLIKTVESEIDRCQWSIDYHWKQHQEAVIKKESLESELAQLNEMVQEMDSEELVEFIDSRP